MRRWATVTLVLALTSLCIAQTAPLVPPEVLAQIKDDDPNLLPRYMTAAERLIPLPVPQRDGGGPPTGEVHCATEYDLNEGMLIRWGHYNSILTELTVGVTTLDPQAISYILVTDPSQQSSATATLTSAGANMAQVEFITYTTNTGWIRDYGPRFVFEDGIRVIIDHTYNRPRPLDNAFPNFLASLWGEPEYDMPLVHGGGNFHSFANGDAFMSDLILLENPGLSEQDVKDYIAAYTGCDLTIYEGFPWSVDGTKHIDMWMMPIGDYEVIIGEYSQAGTYPPQQITDAAAADLIARGYTVYRTPGWNSGPGGYNGTHYTYTNSVILNDLVFLSRFNGYETQNAEALAVFQEALPDHQIIQVDCSSIIYAAGAIHCSMMHVPAYDLGPVPVVNVLSPDGGEVWTVGQEYDIRWVAIDNVGVTSVDINLSTDGGASFPHEIATGLANSGVYAWEVPALPSEQCRVKVVAHDGEGNFGEDTSDGDFIITSFGPQVMYEFLMDTDPGWSTEDLWAFGQPTGGGGQYGGPDPTSGHTGDNVYGYNLSGDYQPNLPERHLTSTAIDCTGLGGVTLGFWRWLGVEQPAYDHAYVRVSNDGSNWQTVWQNTAEVADYSWSYQEYDISTVADDQATVYLRWTMGTTDYTWQYCGWNIDDVRIIAVPTILLGDLNCDGVLNAFDIDPFVLALTDPTGYAAAWPNCDRMLADCNGDGEVNAFDIDPFVELLTGP